MGDNADDAVERGEDDAREDGAEERFAFGARITYSHARLAPVTPPPVNLGRARAVRQSDNGLRVDRLDGKGPFWLPRSQIDMTSAVKEYGDEGDLIVSAWIAREKGLAPIGALAPAAAKSRSIRSVRRVVVELEAHEGAWTREALLADLKRIAGIRGVEILECAEHGDK